LRQYCVKLEQVVKNTVNSLNEALDIFHSALDIFDAEKNRLDKRLSKKNKVKKDLENEDYKPKNTGEEELSKSHNRLTLEEEKSKDSKEKKIS